MGRTTSVGGAYRGPPPWPPLPDPPLLLSLVQLGEQERKREHVREREWVGVREGAASESEREGARGEEKVKESDRST